MSYRSKEIKNIVKNESGNAAMTALLVLIAGGLGFVAGRMIPAGNSISHTSYINIAGNDEAAAPKHKVSKDNPLVAKVNGLEITKDDVVDYIKTMPANFQQLPQEAVIQIALEQVINNKILDSKLASANLDNDPEVQKELQTAKKQIERTILIERAVKEAMSEDKIKQAYEEYKKSFPKTEEVKAAHILVKDEAKAKELIKKLEKGADFAKLAAENSIDGTAKSGGELGYFAEQEVVPAFAKAAFETKVGSFTKKPVKSDFGYHIIKVEDKRVRPPADYETAKPYLEKEIGRKLYNEIVAKWREEAEIIRYDADGKPLELGQKPKPQADKEKSEDKQAEVAQKKEGEAAGASTSPADKSAVEPATGSDEKQDKAQE